MSSTFTPNGHTLYPSLYEIGAVVRLTKDAGRLTGEIVGIRFTESKVLYDLDLDIGGETLRDVDSALVKGQVLNS